MGRFSTETCAKHNLKIKGVWMVCAISWFVAIVLQIVHHVDPGLFLLICVIVKFK